ncbi:MAG: S-4TM family putative pore-forming effector [Candidatus Coproplasma sp.]
MKNSSTVASRQNHSQAITLLKASYRCFRAERVIKYIMIFLSFSICLAAIFNRYLPTLFPTLENLEKIQQDTSTYLNLISGGILVAGLPLGFYCNRMHTEGTVLRDRYDAYVFDNKENNSILRPISDTYIDLYAKKVHKADRKFYNYVYGNEPAPDDAVAQFEYINKEVHSDYNLYVSIQPFFLTIWVGFCILIIIIAVSFNDMFVTTLINIMIPSLSAITTIGNSWYNCKLQMKQLTNLINCVDRIKELPPEQFNKYITDKDKMRKLADGLFNYRSSAFVIPNFLVKHYHKSAEKAKIAAVAKRALNVDEVAASAAIPTVTASADDVSLAKTKAVNVKVENVTKSATPAQPPENKDEKAAKPAVKTKSSAKNTATAKYTTPVKDDATAKSAEKAKDNSSTAKTATHKPTASSKAATKKQKGTVTINTSSSKKSMSSDKNSTPKKTVKPTATEKKPAAKTDKPSQVKK